jgi:hypothetical protein
MPRNNATPRRFTIDPPVLSGSDYRMKRKGGQVKRALDLFWFDQSLLCDRTFAVRTTRRFAQNEFNSATPSGHLRAATAAVFPPKGDAVPAATGLSGRPGAASFRTYSWESLTSSGVDRRLPFSSFIYIGCSASDIGRQIAVMECFGIQNFPFLRACLKGLTSQYDACLTSSGVWVDVHLGKMDVD